MKKLAIVFAGILLCAISVLSISLITDHYTNARLGTNDSETGLTPSSAANLVKLGSYLVDGDVYAQPLYVSSVAGVASRTLTNVLLVATQHNSLYAFDADGFGPPLWKTNFGGNQSQGSYPGHVGDLIYQRENGCKGTPAVDATNKLVYSVCTSGTTWVLRKTSLTSGSTIASVIITATISGVTFCPLCQQNTSGVTLANGNVYVTFGSFADQTNNGNWYGWVIGYAQSDLSSIGAFCTTCGGGLAGGGIWQSGGGPSVDDSGNLYVVTGNGSGTPASGNLCVSVAKLSPTLSLLDWYAPSTYATLNSNDWDLSTGRPMLTTGANPSTSLLTFGAKDFNVYALNTSCMGNIGGTANSCTAPQVFVTGSGSPTDHQGIYGSLFIPGLSTGYFPNTAGKIYAFTLTGSTWNTIPVSSSATYEFPGAQMTGSCNAGTNCVIFATMPVSASSLFSPVPAKMVALNSSTLAELWSSNTNASDALGTLAKLTVPTIAAGKIYAGVLSQNPGTASPAVVVYGVPNFRHIIIGTAQKWANSLLQLAGI